MAFDRNLLHYDDPPSDQLPDLEGLRKKGGFRFANALRAWIEVEDGRVTASGYSGKVVMGLTPLSLGPTRIMLPTIRNRVLQAPPMVVGDGARFVQTGGGRPGFSLIRPMPRWPFIATRPATIWTTLALTIKTDGSYTFDVVGASPFPRHWIYDDDGHLRLKVATTRFRNWMTTVFGRHTPWGGQDREATVSEAESELEMVLARDIMHGAEKPRIQQIGVGDALVRQGEEGDQLCLVLDGVFEVEVDGRVVGRIGPGTVVGERALLEQGKRTATIRAVTECRAAFTGPHGFSEDVLTGLAELHHREALLDVVGTGGRPNRH